MEYIIDGCNYIKFFDNADQKNFELQKDGLINRVNQYASGKNVTFCIVFDSTRISQQKIGKGVVIHTRDADKKIIQIVNECKYPQALTVITNDKRLIAHVKDRGAKSMPVISFNEFLMKKTEQQSQSMKNKGAEKPRIKNMGRKDVEKWKRELGLI